MFQGIFIGLVFGFVLFLVFQAGVFVGHRKAAFSFRFGDNYYRVFEGQPRGGKFFTKMRGPFPDKLIEGHGAVGEVVSVDMPTFAVLGRDGVEKSILVEDDTVIRRFREEVEPADIAVGDFAVVLGEPNEDSQIEAKFIRILPPPSGFTETRAKP